MVQSELGSKSLLDVRGSLSFSVVALQLQIKSKLSRLSGKFNVKEGIIGQNGVPVLKGVKSYC